MAKAVSMTTMDSGLCNDEHKEKGRILILRLWNTTLDIVSEYCHSVIPDWKIVK